MGVVIGLCSFLFIFLIVVTAVVERAAERLKYKEELSQVDDKQNYETLS